MNYKHQDFGDVNKDVSYILLLLYQNRMWAFSSSTESLQCKLLLKKRSIRREKEIATLHSLQSNCIQITTP